jgi:hypothetical protein
MSIYAEKYNRKYIYYKEIENAVFGCKGCKGIKKAIKTPAFSGGGLFDPESLKGSNGLKSL